MQKPKHSSMRKAHANKYFSIIRIVYFRIGLMNGISLAEILIGTAIIAILAGVVFLNLSNSRGFQDLEFDSKIIVSALRDAQQRSIIQEEDKDWGIGFFNISVNPDYYILFKDTAALTPVSTTYLKSSLEFDAVPPPGIGGFNEIHFAKISGTSTPATIRIKLTGADCGAEPEKCKIVTVNANGSIAL